jgi:hypothetical protein
LDFWIYCKELEGSSKTPSFPFLAHQTTSFNVCFTVIRRQYHSSFEVHSDKSDFSQVTTKAQSTTRINHSHFIYYINLVVTMSSKLTRFFLWITLVIWLQTTSKKKWKVSYQQFCNLILLRRVVTPSHVLILVLVFTWFWSHDICTWTNQLKFFHHVI